MNDDCTYAWQVVSAPSKDAAEKSAVDVCTMKSGGACSLFDADGTICGNQVQLSSCGGHTYDSNTHQCCGGKHVFDRGRESCCAGVVFKTGYYGCCGGHKLFRTSTQGCCLDDGVQLYEVGKQNCCRRPSGVCTIVPGEYSCCS